MLLALALTLDTAAADCMARGEYIIMEDDLMRVSIDNADDIEIQVETLIADDRVPWSDGAGEVIEAGPAALAEGELRRGFYVYEDHVMMRMGSTGLTIDEGTFLIAGMGTEVVVFLSGDFVYEDDIIFATSAIAGPLEAIEGEIPTDAVQLIPTPRCE